MMARPKSSKGTSKFTHQCIVPSIDKTTTDKSYRVFKGYVASATADIEGA